MNDWTSRSAIAVRQTTRTDDECNLWKTRVAVKIKLKWRPDLSPCQESKFIVLLLKRDARELWINMVRFDNAVVVSTGMSIS